MSNGGKEQLLHTCGPRQFFFSSKLDTTRKKDKRELKAVHVVLLKDANSKMEGRDQMKTILRYWNKLRTIKIYTIEQNVLA